MGICNNKKINIKYFLIFFFIFSNICHADTTFKDIEKKKVSYLDFFLLNFENKLKNRTQILRNEMFASRVQYSNIGTRIDKIHNNEYDGIILAAAGLIRIGQQSNIAQYLPIDKFTPDPGQGVLAIQARETDTRTVEILSAIDHLPTTTALKAERAFMETLGANCKTPLAAYARQQGDLLQILTMAILPDGTKFYTTNSTYDPNFPTVAGKQSACDLLATGASKIINLTNTIADNK